MSCHVMLFNVCNVLLYNMRHVMLHNMCHVMVYNMCHVMLCYIICVMLCYITCVMLYNMCHVMLYKMYHVMLYNILLSKLQIYGCSSSTVQWFTSYLSDRSQCTSLKGTLSWPSAFIYRCSARKHSWSSFLSIIH